MSFIREWSESSNATTKKKVNVDFIMIDVFLFRMRGRLSHRGLEFLGQNWRLYGWSLWRHHYLVISVREKADLHNEMEFFSRPYEIPPCGDHGNVTYDPCPNDMYPTPKCTKQCVAGYPTSYTDDKYFGKTAAAVGTTVAAIQKEIM